MPPGATSSRAANGMLAGDETEAAQAPPPQELWFIGRMSQVADQMGLAADFLPDGEGFGEVPGCGGLVTDDVPGESFVPVPLEHTGVEARLFGGLASVAVKQRFSNPFDSKIEAVYVFPLPEDAAVSEFLMTIGERTIRGIIREREEAEQLYTQARAQGYVASLMTQERPNVFTQKVANIEPGKTIDVEVEYYHHIPYADGWYELSYPMVVGPRYNPPARPIEAGAAETGVGAVARGASGTSGQQTEVPYLASHERSGHDIALTVDLRPGVPIHQLECSTHEIVVERPDSNSAHVSLAAPRHDPEQGLRPALPRQRGSARRRLPGATLRRR